MKEECILCRRMYEAARRANIQMSVCNLGLDTSAKLDVPRDFAKTTPIAFFDSYRTLKRPSLHHSSEISSIIAAHSLL